MALQARVWIVNEKEGEDFADFPEKSSNLPSTGVCLSGGGTRAYSAAVGQLRALSHLIDWKQVGYLSAVSGGAWASSIFTYYSKTITPGGDEQLLGTSLTPEQRAAKTLEQWQQAPDPASMLHAPTTSFVANLVSETAKGILRPEQAWINAVGRTFLMPYGMWEPQEKSDEPPYLFTLSKETAKEIRERPEQDDVIKNSRFLTMHSGRPFPIWHTTMFWPEERADHMLDFQVTPLYAGVARRTTLSTTQSKLCGLLKKTQSRVFGGGFVEPFALGSGTMAPVPEGEDANGSLRTIRVWEKNRDRFGLSDAIGTSSFKPADSLVSMPIATALVPERPVLDPVSAGPVHDTRDVGFGDGGSLDNFGVLSLMQRGIQRILVCVNTNREINMAYDPASYTKDGPSVRFIDTVIASLFGLAWKDEDDGGKLKLENPLNQVWSQEDGLDLVKRLQVCRRAGKPTIVTTSYPIKADAIGTKTWGIPATSSVPGQAYCPTICWVYLDVVPSYQDAVHASVQPAVKQGFQEDSNGLLQHFPHYLTQGQNGGLFKDPFNIMQLTPMQASMLADFTEWCMDQEAEQVRALFAS